MIFLLTRLGVPLTPSHGCTAMTRSVTAARMIEPNATYTGRIVESAVSLDQGLYGSEAVIGTCGGHPGRVAPGAVERYTRGV